METVTNPEQKTAPTAAPAAQSASDDQLMAALAHAGILITVIVALIIWLTQKDKSKYVKYQAKQALVYQVIVAVVMPITGVMISVIGIFTLGIGLILYLPWMIVMAAVVLYGLYAAWETYQGKDFKYWMLGDMLAKAK
jgi:uncharacterized Tic20 family protein